MKTNSFEVGMGRGSGALKGVRSAVIPENMGNKNRKAVLYQALPPPVIRLTGFTRKTDAFHSRQISSPLKKRVL